MQSWPHPQASYLPGLQPWEGLGGRGRSQLVWRLLGVDRNGEGQPGHSGWRSRGGPLRGHRGSCGPGRLAGGDQLCGALAGVRGSAPLLEEGVGEPHSGLGRCAPPVSAVPSLAVADAACQRSHPSCQEHQGHQHADRKSPGGCAPVGQWLCAVGRGPACLAVTLPLVVADPVVVALGGAVPGSVDMEALAASIPADLARATPGALGHGLVGTGVLREQSLAGRRVGGEGAGPACRGLQPPLTEQDATPVDLAQAGGDPALASWGDAVGEAGVQGCPCTWPPQLLAALGQ